jgi:hypothetical protein
MNIRPESRAKFKKQGVFLTQHHLTMNNMEPTEKLEIVAWLAEEEARSKKWETIRYSLMLGATIVAAVAAIIAAVK